MFLDPVLKLFWKNTERMDNKRIATLRFPEGVYESNNHEYLSDGNAYHKLDVYYPENAEGKLPVIIDVHGGGWMYGDKELNKNYCLTLAKRGNVVFNISYRLYPEVTADEQLRDVAAALKWINENLDSFPCDRDSICLTGDSAGGMLAGFCFQKGWLPRKPVYLGVFGFLAVILWVGPLLDSSHIFLVLTTITLKSVIAPLISGFYVNISQAIGTALMLLLLGRPLLEKLDRIKVKYGMLEDKNGF